MIKLIKADEPEILKNKSAEWTQTLLDKFARGEIPTPTELSRYRHLEVKAAILKETHGKCAYCESKLRHIHHGDVEHIFPKSLDQSLRFTWSNLTLACEICNQNKSNTDPNLEHIIDPYKVDPEEHIVFAGALAFPKGTPHGQSTTTLLDLNRVELVERRQEKLSQIMSSYNIALQQNLPEPTRRAILNNLANHDAADSAPYAAMARSANRLMTAEVAI